MVCPDINVGSDMVLVVFKFLKEVGMILAFI